MEKTKEEDSRVPQFVNVEVFVNSVASIYHLSRMQKAGFVSLMKTKGMYVVPDMESYIPHLKKYLGIK
ncbi:hypothetical protein [Lactobacillus phage Lbab1]|nr:hypothetical protein [Lactobacillus phage Lbab1]